MKEKISERKTWRLPGCTKTSGECDFCHKSIYPILHSLSSLALEDEMDKSDVEVALSGNPLDYQEFVDRLDTMLKQCTTTYNLELDGRAIASILHGWAVSILAISLHDKENFMVNLETAVAKYGKDQPDRPVSLVTSMRRLMYVSINLQIAELLVNSIAFKKLTANVIDQLSKLYPDNKRLARYNSMVQMLASGLDDENSGDDNIDESTGG